MPRKKSDDGQDVADIPETNGEPELDAPEPSTDEQNATQSSIDAQTEKANNPEYLQKPETDELPGHLAAKRHAPYEVKPIVQHVNESLTDDAPTGYAPHKVGDEVPRTADELQADGELPPQE